MTGGTDVSASKRMEMLKAFDETKAGVKGLTDSGIEKIPSIFVRPSEEVAEELNHGKIQVQIPVIDLSGILNLDRRKEIVEEVRLASETMGFFQVVNHGIPLNVLDGMIEGVRKFHEQDLKEKMKFYTREWRDVKFQSNHDLFESRTASWRDTLSISFWDHDQDIYNDLPVSCRDSTMEYLKHLKMLGNSLLELLSEALGLKVDHLKNMECFVGQRIHGHYYPACPEPDLTLGTQTHSDPGFLNILLQTQTITALEVLYNGHWVDVHPIPGGLVINIGDLLQLVSNGRFKSNRHRSTANIIGPRISVACFFSGSMNDATTYGPIQDLVSEENPPSYREIVLSDYRAKFVSTAIDNYRALDYYKL